MLGERPRQPPGVALEAGEHGAQRGERGGDLGVGVVEPGDHALVVRRVLMVVQDQLPVDLAHLPVRDDLLDLVVDRQERLVDLFDHGHRLLALAGVQLVDPLPPEVGDAVAELGVLDQALPLALLDDAVGSASIAASIASGLARPLMHTTCSSSSNESPSCVRLPRRLPAPAGTISGHLIPWSLVLIMSDALVRSRTTAAHRRAVVCGDHVLDHATLADRCEQVVGALRGLGLDRGDRVAVLAANCHRYVELYFGVPVGRPRPAAAEHPPRRRRARRHRPRRPAPTCSSPTATPARSPTRSSGS